MGKLFKFLVVVFLLVSTNSFSQMKENVVILDDVTLHILDNNEITLDLRKSNISVLDRKIEIYQVLYDLPVVDSEGEINGVVLNWDSTEYSGKWFQNSGEYKLKITYSDKNIQSKEIIFNIN